MKKYIGGFASAVLVLVFIALQMAPAGAVSSAAVKNSSGMTYSTPRNLIRAATVEALGDYEGSVYSSRPSVKAPYYAGSLTQPMLTHGLKYFNCVRLIAKLPAVQTTAELNDSAQHGAVLLAAYGSLSHTPSKPLDMETAFYNKGYEATSKGNISQRKGYSDLDLTDSLRGCMNDDSSVGNLTTLGHRRWMLNPQMLNTGFGYAENEAEEETYMVTRVNDRSRAETVDYSYIAWPSAGHFPSRMITETAPWSVTLNPDDYQTPSASDVVIEVERESTDESWTIDASDVSTSPLNTDEYLCVDTQRYGIDNCIIFSIGTNNDGTKLNGIYKVTLSGIKTKSGDEAVIEYIVDFFDVYGSYRPGDVDDSGTVTATDARTILRAATGLETLTGKALEASLISEGTTKPSASDARSVLRAATGLESFDDDYRIPTTETAPGGYENIESGFVQRVNQYRSGRSMTELSDVLPMRNAAQARANEISVGSQNPFNVQLDALNISYSKVMQHTYQCLSEEEAPTADSLYTSFISSAQLNFLSEISKQDYTRIGVGITMKDNWYYVVVYLVK